MIDKLTPKSTAKSMPAMAPAIGVAARRSTCGDLLPSRSDALMRYRSL
jgi:hypothetical protein